MTVSYCYFCDGRQVTPDDSNDAVPRDAWLRTCDGCERTFVFMDPEAIPAMCEKNREPR